MSLVTDLTGVTRFRFPESPRDSAAKPKVGAHRAYLGLCGPAAGVTPVQVYRDRQNLWLTPFDMC